MQHVSINNETWSWETFNGCDDQWSPDDFEAYFN